MAVNRPLAGDREAVATVGIDERREIAARLALDARFDHRIRRLVIHTLDHGAALKMQVHAGLEEKRPCPVDARRDDQRPAAAGGDAVDLGLQRPDSALRGMESRGKRGNGNCQSIHSSSLY